ncbi:MAG: hypothetical protein KME28_02780 [Pelatocladus maniniholoensis HA4357-MV3]|jgi:uncharacterized protein with von Willebrand factor type A (vWA) domain|uniref:VWA containing CoxE family protein n=1 Tax=Pelatocladus maniniholoensis HA4357-MV3 TaxID=1117104 RepID=A0A9E3LRP1_9NOST|nr:hypothetical protein [Pelatocladus maniniholoensis HA4357-MV3]
MNECNLPLYKLFMRLREAKFLIGVDDYNLLLQVLLHDYDSSEASIFSLGVPSLDSLKQLCKLLWVKSASQRLEFSVIFDDIFDDIFTRKTLVKEKPEPISNKPDNLLPQPETTNKKPPDKPPQYPEPKNEPEYFFFPPPIDTSTGEPEKIVKAVRIGKAQELSTFKPSGLPKEYLPVTKQQMQQAWDSLHRLTRQGLRRELDVAATIEQIKKHGKFFHPVQIPRLLKSGKLVLLIDQKGSMQPFHVLSGLLVETARELGCVDTNNCYYFNNYPRRMFYCDPQFETEIPVNQVIQDFHPHRTIILIFSDGGAARGNFIMRRIDKTQELLQNLRQRCQALVWINPLPKNYWQNTTSEAIANIIQMFPADLSGFENALRVLR